MQASWNGQVIAESEDIVTVEGNAYFPSEALRRDVVRESSHTSVCPWKGTAHYYSLEVDGQTNPNAVWYYDQPKQAAENIRGRVAFWKGVKITG
jgi:uncharacterized protein (DUF427 family)